MGEGGDTKKNKEIVENVNCLQIEFVRQVAAIGKN